MSLRYWDCAAIAIVALEVVDGWDKETAAPFIGETER